MKVLIGTPVYNNQLDSRMVHSVVDVINEFHRRKEGLNWDRPSSVMLAYNRNLCALTAIQEKYEWLLFWDADISVDNEIFPFQMIDTAHKYDAPIVALPIRLKHPSLKFYNFAYKLNGEYKNWDRELPLMPVEVDIVGTGIMLIKTEVFEKLAQPWFHHEDTFGENRVGFFPEDWYFCEKARAKGYRIMIEPRIKSIHWGQFGYE